VKRLAQERIIKSLKTFGFGQYDAKVYAFLLAKGPQRGKVIATSLNLPNWRLYSSLRRLQDTGIVTSSVRRPTVFSSVAYEKVIDQFIEAKRQQVWALQKSREQLLSNWRARVIQNHSDTAKK
jgi:sugar-specific transcriptional regulator TrmB